MKAARNFFASRKPAAVQTRPTTTESARYAAALFHSPTLRSCTDSREKVEKVVNEPRKPVKMKRRTSSPMWDRSVSPQRRPIRKQPSRFTTRVPNGNTGPARRCTTTKSPCRQMAPILPPIMIASTFIGLWEPVGE